MKAIVQDVYGGPDVLRLKDVDQPVPGSDDVLVRVRAAGVDPGVWHLMRGMPYLIRLMGFGFRAPKQPIRGMDVAGLVEAVGANVSGLRPGDEVFGTCDGSFAEYVCAKADQFAVKPSNVDFQQAAVVPVSGCTALQALRDKGQIQAGQRVLIIGAAGGVGTFAVQLAKAFDTHVTGVCSTDKLDLVRSIGADEVVDYTNEDVTSRTERYDLIVDTAGVRALSALRRILTERGTLVLVGGETSGRLLGGLSRTLGAFALSPFVKQRLVGMFSTAGHDDLVILSRQLEAGRIKPVIDRTYPLDQAAEAVAYLETNHARGKVVLTV